MLSPGTVTTIDHSFPGWGVRGSCLHWPSGYAMHGVVVVDLQLDAADRRPDGVGRTTCWGRSCSSSGRFTPSITSTISIHINTAKSLTPPTTSASANTRSPPPLHRLVSPHPATVLRQPASRSTCFPPRRRCRTPIVSISGEPHLGIRLDFEETKLSLSILDRTYTIRNHYGDRM